MKCSQHLYKHIKNIYIYIFIIYYILAYMQHMQHMQHIGTSSWWSEQRTDVATPRPRAPRADENFCLPGAAVSGACRETGSPGTRQ